MLVLAVFMYSVPYTITNEQHQAYKNMKIYKLMYLLNKTKLMNIASRTYFKIQAYFEKKKKSVSYSYRVRILCQYVQLLELVSNTIK